MTNHDLVKYFIEQTNHRFHRLEKKIDKLIEFRWLLIGVSFGVSGVASLAFQLVLLYFKKGV